MPETTTRELDAERPRLTALAFRMLGTLADAEDAVQEGFTRYLALPPSERDEIRVPAAWLTRVVSRVCLDALGSARHQRVTYVGEWLPEPVPASALSWAPEPADPEHRAIRRESVSTALLVVLESLTPAERIVFVLREVFGVPYAEIGQAIGRSTDACRQLALSARKRVAKRGDEAGSPDSAEHDRLVAAFAVASQSGDLSALTRVLAPGVELRSDGNGMRGIARRPVVGADNVARFLLGIAEKRDDLTFEQGRSADGACLVMRNRDGLEGVLNLGTADAGITDVWIVVAPEKLTLW